MSILNRVTLCVVGTGVLSIGQRNSHVVKRHNLPRGINLEGQNHAEKEEGVKERHRAREKEHAHWTEGERVQERRSGEQM